MKPEKEKIAELKQQKRQMQEEQAKAEAAQGAQATQVQTPATAQVPGMVGTTPAADAAGTAGAVSASAAGSGTTGTVSATAAGSETTPALSDTAAKVQDYVDTYSTMAPADVAKILENMISDDGELVAMIFQALPTDQRSGILSGMSTDNAVWLTEQTSPLPKQAKSAAEQDAQQAVLQEQEKMAEEAALQEYVDTYSAMNSQNAAQIFDSIMPGQSELVTRILQKMTANQRADILSQMSVDNAAALTVKMEK